MLAVILELNNGKALKPASWLDLAWLLFAADGQGVSALKHLGEMLSTFSELCPTCWTLKFFSRCGRVFLRIQPYFSQLSR